MPYGIRYIASQMKEAMREKFNASEDETNHVVGNLIYYRYMNPAIAAPEAFDVIDSAISPVQRKNLAEIAKTLYQLSYNKQTATDNTAYGATLNEYITRGGKRFQAYFKDAASVMTPEEHFGIDEFADAGRQQKPTIYITPKEIFSIHRNLDDNINDIAPTEEADELRIVLKALGPPPPARDVAPAPRAK
ncbi:Rho GTPase activation protein [Caulochytrium protostelioides]|uniref:Rho GTPase activation protein n=1 Tax=Caulochytrium protostelioides TaxID=1555241 RepID=A0A4P9WV08_9FUNG|nr:Rho GTPase activation protein [Caulochytrium protostelioides]